MPCLMMAILFRIPFETALNLSGKYSRLFMRAKCKIVSPKIQGNSTLGDGSLDKVLDSQARRSEFSTSSSSQKQAVRHTSVTQK